MNEEKIASYETQLQHLRSHVQQLEQQQQQQQNLPSVDYQKLKTENEALSSTHRASEQEMETLRKEISDLKTDKSFIDEESTILRQEKDDLKEELEKHKDSFNELKKRNEEFAQQIQMLHAENQRLVNSNHLSKKVCSRQYLSLGLHPLVFNYKKYLRSFLFLKILSISNFYLFSSRKTL